MSRYPDLSAAGQAVPASIFARLREHLARFEGDVIPLQIGDTYLPPPATMSDQVLSQFVQLASAIGQAIGNVAAHETAHRLRFQNIRLLNMDCVDTCPGNNKYVYESGASGSGAFWWYTDIPSKKFDWIAGNKCRLEAILRQDTSLASKCQ